MLALVGHGTPDLSPTALLRATLLVADVVDAAVVAVPLASHGDPQTDHDLGVQVVSNYAGDDPVEGLGEGGELPLELVEIVERDQPDPADQGLVLFFTGLSGSGKSTLAQALMDRILERGERSLTSLDGDVVRRNLSAGLTFSKTDRETNIRRIGWVAAEVSRHGGVAVCSPIAPFDETRQQVRQMVETPAARSSSSMWPRRSRSANVATARASTRRPAPARSPSSPASPPPTRSPMTPTSASTPPAAPSTTPSTTS